MIQKTANRMTLTLVSDREVAVTRAFDAPRSLVFEVWSRCEHMKNWWGPHGFDLIECNIDLRPGGKYRFVQRAPDGSIHGFNGGTDRLHADLRADPGPGGGRHDHSH